MNTIWKPATISPPLQEEDYCKRTIDVIITDGKDQWIGYLQTWEDEEFSSEWKIKGRDSYIAENITHWTELPTLPKTST